MTSVLGRGVKLNGLRSVLTFSSIAANALCAGGIFMFPVFSPALASRLKLTQPQLTTIVLAGMTGQYPFSPIVGKILDRYGPSTCSFISGVLFSSAFGLCALEISSTPENITQSSPSSFHRLTFLFLMAGLATVFSYFSSVFAATRNLPNHPGIASGVSMALFGLSPFFLSIIASNFFTEPSSGLLNLVGFMKFLAILTASIHAVGIFSLRNAAITKTEVLPSNLIDDNPVDENTTLLPDQRAFNSAPSLNPLQDRNFWLLAFFCLFTVGASEMVISNMGTIVLSLPSSSSVLWPGVATSDNVNSNQVRLLSISNTLSRLLVGPLADFVSPVASYSPTGVMMLSRKHRVSRVVFLSGPALLLAAAFLWMEFVTSRESVWALSVGTGISYGAIFTMLPSILSSIWGVPNLGRNFGLLTYAPCIGTPLFSYLYAFVSASNSQGIGICKGTVCWQTTFWLCIVASMLAFCSSLLLCKEWKGRV